MNDTLEGWRKRDAVELVPSGTSPLSPLFYNRNIRKKRKREKSGCLIATRLSKVIDDVYYRPYTRLYTSVQQRINGAVRGHCSDVQQGAALYSRCIVATQPERKLYIYTRTGT